ncbi:retrovirus-related pol polyprotein from transposon TNT 1-94 [Tanacetum coccineum]
MNELVNDGIKLSKLVINTSFINGLPKKWLESVKVSETLTMLKILSLLLYLVINIGFINGLPKKWLSFCQSLRNTNHVKDFELASLFEDVSSDDNEMTEVKVLMALVDDENVVVSKESTRNGEWVKIIMKKVHTLLDMKDNDERKSFIDYLCIDLNYVEDQLTTSPLLNQKDTHMMSIFIAINLLKGNPGAGMLTKSMAKELSVASAHECLFVDFLSEEEPKKVSKALKHPGWVDAMQKELNQSARNKVWTLVPALYGKNIIGSKWVFRNKRDETRIFLAFVTYMNFTVYQIDVKSAFLNGKVKKEVYVKQPSGFESSEFLNHV